MVCVVARAEFPAGAAGLLGGECTDGADIGVAVRGSRVVRLAFVRCLRPRVG